MDGLKPYPEYKPSRLPWLQQIPAHWDEKRAKCYFREVDERSASGQEELLSVSHITGVTPRSQKNVTMFKAESYIGHKLCRRGDLVVNTMWAWMAALGIAKQTGLVSPSYATYRPQNGQTFDPEFVDALLRTEPYRTEYVCRSTGIRSSRLRLYPEKFLDIPVVCPPYGEQVQISACIRHLNTSIAHFIRSKRQQIDLLKEHNRALTRAAVCHGFGDLKRVPSGVGWIGDVPSHWSIQRLKVVASLQRGYDLPGDQRQPGEYPVVSSGGLIGTHNAFRSPAPGIAMGRYGSTESVFFLEKNFWPHNTSLFVTDFHGNEPKWCFYLLQTIPKGDLSAKSAVPGIDRNDLHEMYVPCPPVQDQRQIVGALELQLGLVDEYAKRVQRQLDLARGYRTRLIADVVTGQVDVRDIAIEPIAGVAAQNVGLESIEESEPELEEAAIGDE